MVNGLKGVHIASGIPVEIPLNGKEMQLAMHQGDGVDMNKSWEMMCDSVMHREGIGIIGEIDIEFLVINGVHKVFH